MNNQKYQKIIRSVAIVHMMSKKHPYCVFRSIQSKLTDLTNSGTQIFYRAVSGQGQGQVQGQRQGQVRSPDPGYRVKSRSSLKSRTVHRCPDPDCLWGWGLGYGPELRPGYMALSLQQQSILF